MARNVYRIKGDDVDRFIFVRGCGGCMLITFLIMLFIVLLFGGCVAVVSGFKPPTSY